MAKREKLIAAIRNNPQSVRFHDACKAAEIIGFTETDGRGSHCVYTKADTQDILNFQNKEGYIYPYQAHQLIKMLDKYEGGLIMQHYPIHVFWSNEDNAYIAIAPDLAGCSAGGATEFEAIQELHIAIELWLEAARKIGKPIPSPSSYPLHIAIELWLDAARKIGKPIPWPNTSPEFFRKELDAVTC